jgi:hypothetical protein
MGRVVVKLYASLTLTLNALETRLHAPAVLPQGKGSRYTLDMKLDEPQSG